MVLLWCEQVCPYIIKLTLSSQNCSSLSPQSAVYGGHSIFEKPQRNAVAAWWCSSTSGKGYHCVSECKQRKCRQLPPSPRTIRFKHNWKHLGWTKPPCEEFRGYSDHTEQLRSKILYGCNNHPQNYVQLYVTSMRRLVMPKWTVRGTYLLLSLHGHKRHCKIWLKYIVIFTLFVTFSTKFGLFLSIGKKCDLRFYINFEFCVGIF